MDVLARARGVPSALPTRSKSDDLHALRSQLALVRALLDEVERATTAQRVAHDEDVVAQFADELGRLARRVGDHAAALQTTAAGGKKAQLP